VSDNVDSSKSHLNEILGKAHSTAELSQLIENRISDENLKKDAKSTRVMEFIISASPEQLSSESFNQAQYFKDALKWAESLHGSENVVSAVIHRDEDTPHLHVHVVPINQIEQSNRKRSVQVKGGKVGERVLKPFVVEAHNLLSANVLYGGPRKLSALQTAFEQQVGVEHGLGREKRFIEGQKYEAEPYKSPRKYRQEIDAEKKRLDAEKAALAADRVVLEEDRQKLAKARHDLNQREAKQDIREVEFEDLVDQHQAQVVKDRAGLVTEKAWLTEQHSRLSAEIRDRGLALDQREASIADDLKHLERVSRGQENVKAGLEQREAAAVKEWAEIDQARLDVVQDQETLNGYKDALNADIAAFKADRAAYHKQWFDKIKAAPEAEKPQAAQELVTPVRKGRSR